MELTYSIVVFIATYVCGAITKMFSDTIPSKYIPIQNVCIGIVSGLFCYYAGLETNLIKSILLCLFSATGAGGTADLVQTKFSKEDKK